MAVLITAVISIVVISMVTRQQVEVRRTTNVVDRDQALLFTQGAEAWAKRILHEDKTKNNIDHLYEDWAIKLPPIDVEGGQVSGALYEQNGCFNINNLLDANGVANLEQVA
ncbi:MAG: general secretion pathway protein GspK, partial [Gammaproteobacteria bacterium]|nr:general secretion pathway protein GspK [Gammaproteobacteria bacterium]